MDFSHQRQAGEFAGDIPAVWARKTLTEQAKRKIFSENAIRFYAMKQHAHHEGHEGEESRKPIPNSP